MNITLIAAYSLNLAIGKGDEIPWHYPEDFAHFKRETLGNILLMGRATWDTIGRPLPGRETIVMTRDYEWKPKGYEDKVKVVHSVEEGLKAAELLPGELMIAGGEQIYRLFLPHATHQILTEIPLLIGGATAFFPKFNEEDWIETHNKTEGELYYRWLEKSS